MRKNLILTIAVTAVASGLGYLFYNKTKKKGLKEVATIKKLDDHDYVIYFDRDEFLGQIEEKFV